MDTHTKQVRSYNMSKIRSKNTKPEEVVRHYLFHHGFRYRKNFIGLPGCPDIVIPKYRTVVFINGCFWHVHECRYFVWPNTNVDFWKKKLTRNIERDRENYSKLSELGWRVIIIWECELKRDSLMNRLELLLAELTLSINHS